MIKKIFLKVLIILCFFLISKSFAVVLPVFKQSTPVPDITDDAIGGPGDVTFSADGTKIHFTNFSNENASTSYHKLRQFTLTTPFDISTLDTATEVQIDLNAGSDDTGNFVQGHEFNNDGTKVIVIQQGGKLNIHTLTTPYDISDFSQDADDGVNYRTAFVGSAVDDDIRSRDITFNNDGTKMYLIDGGDNNIGDGGVIEYDLSTPFVPSTATFVNELVVSGELSLFEQDVEFDDDGTRMYVIDSHTTANSNAKIAVYKLSTPFHTSTATFVGSIANFFDASGGTGTPLGLGFSSDGMKLYQTTYTISGSGDLDRVYEYDLTCPYGIVICETETASVVGAQVEIAKNVIHQNTSTIFKRFEWLRRNENKTNLNSHNLKLNIYNPILASLTNELQSSFKDFKYTQASLKTEKPSNDKRKWSRWTHGDISFGRVGDKALIKPKEITTKGISIGADRLTKNDNFFGYAVRYGNDDVDIKSGTGDELNSQSLSFNVYGQLPVNSKSNLNALLGVSFLSIDQMISGTVTGERYGKQIYTALSYEEEQNYTRFDIIPYGKAELGITQLSEYTDFGTTATNNVETHEKLTFKTGNASAGFKFDRTLYIDESRISRNGFLEYVVDFTPDIDHQYKNHHDNVTVQNTIKRYSLNNIKGNIGFELFKKSGHTFALNYERFQSLDNSAHTDSLLFKFGRKKNENTNFNVIYDPLKNNNTEISYIKNYDNFNLKVKSNYAMYSKIPDYGAGIEFSATF